MTFINLSAITPEGETLVASYVRQNERVAVGIVGGEPRVAVVDLKRRNGYSPDLTLVGNNNLTVKVKEVGLTVWEVRQAYEIIWNTSNVIIYNLEADGGYTIVKREKIEIMMISN